MSWTTIIWSAGGGLCLALAAVHLLVWVKSRNAWANLFFSVAAVSAAATAMVELNLMHAQTLEAYGELLHWKYLSNGFITISMVWFIHFYLHGKSAWLVWLYCAWRGLTQILDLLFNQGMYFREITGLRQIPFLGEMVALPIGVPTPWAHFANASNLLIIVIALGGGIAAWRQGNRRRAAVVTGTILAADVLALAQVLIMERGVGSVPYTSSMAFLIIVLGMAYELSADMISAAQLSRELHQTRERMRLAASAANLGMWEWDVIRDEIWISDAILSRLGLRESEHIKLDRFLQSLHPDDREVTRRIVQEAFEAGKEFQAEYRSISASGEVRWIAARGQVSRDAHGMPIRVRGVSLDITEQKQAESERIRLRNELTHVQRVSTMGELSSALAHEVNQPLGAILNNASAAQIISSKLDGENTELGEILADIISDATRAGEVIRKIRGIVKRDKTKFGQLDLNVLIEEVVALYRNAFNIEKISSFLDLQPDLLPIRGDRVQLQQVLMNLINNASQAMRESSSRTLKIRSTMQPSDMIIVSVSDSGTGIDEAKKGKVFEPFFTTKKDGLGMGLRICRSIIEEHGGRIWVENNPAGGATFSFSLKAYGGDSG